MRKSEHTLSDWSFPACCCHRIDILFSYRPQFEPVLGRGLVGTFFEPLFIYSSLFDEGKLLLLFFACLLLLLLHYLFHLIALSTFPSAAALGVWHLTTLGMMCGGQRRMKGRNYLSLSLFPNSKRGPRKRTGFNCCCCLGLLVAASVLSCHKRGGGGGSDVYPYVRVEVSLISIPLSLSFFLPTTAVASKCN